MHVETLYKHMRLASSYSISPYFVEVSICRRQHAHLSWWWQNMPAAVCTINYPRPLISPFPRSLTATQGPRAKRFRPSLDATDWVVSVWDDTHVFAPVLESHAVLVDCLKCFLGVLNQWNKSTQWKHQIGSRWNMQNGRSIGKDKFESPTVNSWASFRNQLAASATETWISRTHSRAWK